MICAEFCYRKGEPRSFKVSGHSGFADKGKDIVCAAVSSAVQMAANGITEIVRTKCDVKVEDNSVELILPESSRPAAWHFVSALRLHLTNLSEDYPGTIDIKVTEV